MRAAMFAAQRRLRLRLARWSLAVGIALAGAFAGAAENAPSRPSLLPLAQPLWSELAPAQRGVLAALEAQWNALPRTSKRSWLQLADQVPAMKPAEREKALARIREWAALTPEQRRLARNNYRLAQGLDQGERAATWEQYQSMTPEQRAVLRASGWTSNTAARHAGAPTGLAKEAARPLAATVQPTSTRRSDLQPAPGANRPAGRRN